MNFIFISPNYPDFFYKFCAALKKRGSCVLGIGDSALICNELKKSLNEYFVIPDMTDFSVMSELTKQIINTYGNIYAIDSINEFWLETESRLREKFLISGTKGDLILDYKFKSRMKARFALANIPIAPWIKSSNRNDIIDFASRQNFPLFCKPDNGVGAEGTHKLSDERQLYNFLECGTFSDYIFEPYIEGELYSFDGLCDKDGDLVFTSAHRFYTPIDKLKENGCECIYRTLTEVPDALYKEGCSAVKAFELKNSFFHIEFFKLQKPICGVADTGSFVAIEANMRVAGGYTAEMLYHSLGLDIYALWAAVVSGEKPNIMDYTISPIKSSAVNIARKIGHEYKYTPTQLKDAFPQEFILFAETAKIENPFGNFEIVAKFTDEVRLNTFIEMTVAKA